MGVYWFCRSYDVAVSVSITLTPLTQSRRSETRWKRDIDTVQMKPWEASAKTGLNYRAVETTKQVAEPVDIGLRRSPDLWGGGARRPPRLAWDLSTEAGSPATGCGEVYLHFICDLNGL